MELSLNIDDIVRPVRIGKNGGDYVVRVEDREYHIKSPTLAEGVLNFFIDNRPYRAYLSRADAETYLAVAGRSYVMRHEPEGEIVVASGAHHHASGIIEAPMPGNIVAVHVKTGDAVTSGTPLVVLESMKMQNEITSPVDGTVKTVTCSAGDQVGYGEVIFEITPDVA